MAKRIDKIETEPGSEVEFEPEPMAVLLVPAPLEQITKALLIAAEGGSGAEVRKTVASVFPKTRPEGARFLGILQRLRDCAEAAHQAGVDAQSRLTE